MQVRISWRDCAKASYASINDCPLFRALVKLGLDVALVGGCSTTIKRPDGSRKFYYFESTYGPFGARGKPKFWNNVAQAWSARRHRSFDVEIPGLEAEFTPEQLEKLGFWKDAK